MTSTRASLPAARLSTVRTGSTRRVPSPVYVDCCEPHSRTRHCRMLPSSRPNSPSPSPMAAEQPEPAWGRYDRVLHAIGERLQLTTTQARPLRRHTSHSYLLPQEGIVVRIAEATDENLKRAAVAAAATTWLSNRGFPCVPPVQDVPIEVADMVATAWRYLPQPEPGGPLPMTVLGTLLRDLHQLPEPAFPLPAVDPLARLRRALSIDAGRQNGILAT